MRRQNYLLSWSTIATLILYKLLQMASNTTTNNGGIAAAVARCRTMAYATHQPCRSGIGRARQTPPWTGESSGDAGHAVGHVLCPTYGFQLQRTRSWQSIKVL